MKLGDQSIESYFRKIKLIITIFTSLDSRVNDEDVVHYALERLLEKYDQVCGFMHHKDIFLDLKTACSMLITKEIHLKNKSHTLPVDSSSPMLLMADSGNSRRSSTSQVKSWRPCFHFAKGMCRFGDGCRFVPDANAKNNINYGVDIKSSSIDDLLIALFTFSSGLIGSIYLLCYLGPSPSKSSDYVTGPTGPPGYTLYLFHYIVGSTGPIRAHNSDTWVSGPTDPPGQATTLPHAFTAGTLHDPDTGSWNMDTSVSSHLNASVANLNDVFNTCIYSSVAVGDGHSIPVTNTGHSILPTLF
ncbi:ribonuclease H-like domain-containing protein [Tanacetum coccineum]